MELEAKIGSPVLISNDDGQQLVYTIVGFTKTGNIKLSNGAIGNMKTHIIRGTSDQTHHGTDFRVITEEEATAFRNRFDEDMRAWNAKRKEGNYYD